MPKKFATENPKAAAARERKQAAKDAVATKKQKDEEEAFWKDDDKSIKKKQQRKEEQEKKREQQLAKKAEAKLLLEQEASATKSGKAPPPAKVTRAQISSQVVKNDSDKEKAVTHLETPLEENINRLTIEGEEARTVDDAISILSANDKDVDKHPEKRMKAAYTAFETRRLNELKLEHPSLRLSQLKQMIFKEWQKSPENPLNQQAN